MKRADHQPRYKQGPLPARTAIDRGFMLLTSLLLLLLVISTFNNNWERWGTAKRLMLDTVSKSPLKQRPRVNLGWAYQQEGDYYNALNQYQNASILYPSSPADGMINYVFIHQNTGQILIGLGRMEEAGTVLLKAWNKQPGHPGLAINLSKVLFETSVGTPQQEQNVNAALDVMKYSISVRDAGLTEHWFNAVSLGMLHFNYGVILRFANQCTAAQDSFNTASETLVDYPVVNLDCADNISY